MDIHKHLNDKDRSSLYFDYTTDFVEFLADKNSISMYEANKLFGMGWSCFGEMGFLDSKYGNFSEFFSEVFKFMHGNSKEEIYNTYRFHGLIDFFRMLSYPIMDTSNNRDIGLYNEILDFLSSRYKKNEEVVLVDYGCGLAHITITLCKLLKKMNVYPKLVCMDIDRIIHKEFLEFITSKHNIDYEYIDINEDNNFPTIPKFDFIQVKDVFEHIYEPHRVVDNINDSIKEGGIISATTDDEGPEMMHVSRDLGHVRAKLDDYGFKVLGNSWFDRGYIYQK
jgi:SAM-dependent methyltransferase|tara:strand:+ start:515 stop:1354 length:840 start_codon:yes stop_codon:yes gene_type:complete